MQFIYEIEQKFDDLPHVREAYAAMDSQFLIPPSMNSFILSLSQSVRSLKLIA